MSAILRALEAEIQAKDEELEDLRRWKAEAIQVMPDFQKIGEILGLTIGQRISPHIVPAIEELARLRPGLDACQAALDLLKKTWPHEHGNPEVGRVWGLLEAVLDGKEPRPGLDPVRTALRAVRDRLACHDGCSRFGIDDHVAIRDADQHLEKVRP